MTSSNPTISPSQQPPVITSSSARSIDDLFRNLDLSDLARGLNTSTKVRTNGMPPIRNHLSARGVNGRPAYDRQNGREAGGHRGKSQKSRSEYQFWPQGVAMGSQVGRKFIQVSHLEGLFRIKESTKLTFGPG